MAIREAQMKRIGVKHVLAATALALLAACGGGGGGGGGLAALATVGIPGATTVTLSGTVTYDSVPNPSGALVYAATTQKPVRGAVVEILNSSSSVIATTSTDGAGAYSVSLPSSTAVVVRVKAQMTQGGSGPTWDVTVRDNTQSGAIYAMETPTFSTGTAALTRNVNAPSGWTGTSYGAARVAAPFAVLDTVYSTQAKVLSVAPGTAFPTLRVFWSVNNLPASGDPTQGQIGTTFFSNDSTGRVIYVLGKENVDTDEYDSSVIAHEWGHYYQSAFSRDDSPGGSHALTDLVDRRVAFSEGWGNAWSGIALGRSNYTDSAGPGQAQGANMDLTVGPASNPGWFREASIQSILWNVNNQVGFKPIHDTMTGPFKSGLPVTSIHPFAAAFNVAASGSSSALAGLLAGQNISTAPNDPFGISETNNGTVSQALPMYVNGLTPACVTNQAGSGNKLGSYVYLRFSVAAAGSHQVSVTGPAGSDPDWVVYNGGQIAASNGLGTSEIATVSLPAGESVLVINDYNNSSANTCFSVTIN
jgi:hypothetical protein